MKVEKDILDAASLASGVETLQSGLTNFEVTTGQMKSIFEDFEGRLNKLEGEMLPMKDISAKLTLARGNITSAIVKMESINECFLLEKELRGVVQKGMRGNVSAVAYLEEIRRINDAIVYFRKWPSLKSQKEAIRGLEDLSNTAAKECIDEFNRLLRTVGPAVQFQTQTNTFESVDTLSDHVAQSLAAIGECLTLLRRDRHLRQTYTNDRRVTVKTVLDSWEAKFETKSIGQEARGGGAWLRFYVDFATKVVTAERLLWERALKASSAEGDERQSSEAEAAFVLVVAPVIEKLVREVDRKLNSSLAEISERNNATSPSAASGGGGSGGGSGGSQIRAKTRTTIPSGTPAAAAKEGDIPADVVLSLLEMSDAMHKGSYSLQNILKVGDGSSSTMDQAGHPRHSSSPTAIASSLGGGRNNKATEALAAVRRRLSQACLHTITNLADAVGRDPKQRRHVPDDGSVHRLSSNVLRGIKHLMRFRKGYEDLVKDSLLPWDNPPGVEGQAARQRSPVGAAGTTAAAQACPRFTTLVNHLIKMLFVNLTEKAGSYPTATLPGAALRDIFLLNNSEYVLVKAKSPFAALSLNNPGGTPSPTPADNFRLIFGEAPSRGGVRSPRLLGKGVAKSKEAVRRAVAERAVSEGLVGPDAGDDELPGLSIADFMTEQMKSLLQRLLEEKHASYVNTLVAPLVAAAKDDIGELKYQRGKLLTLECGRLLKTKFTAFNESWEEVFHSQLSVSVGESGRRVKLRDEFKLKVLVPYRELYETYEGVQFSKKHQEQYLKYTPEAIDEGINQLFSG